ncbi:MAG: prepilin-type N-terminal cleavage/methylation domain-containing protein, partial [Bacilli bacterium]
MKNRKGFTLIELLAVIAILAILIIIALPNVMKMYVKAKKNTFLTEVQN